MNAACVRGVKHEDRCKPGERVPPNYTYNSVICTKARAWFAIVPTDRARLISGADALAEYKWVPPHKPRAFLHLRLCKTCGIGTFVRGYDQTPEGTRLM